MREDIAPGIFYERGLGYVFCGWPSRISIKTLRETWKDVAAYAPVVMHRQGKSKLFYFEGPKAAVGRVLHAALQWRLEWLDRKGGE